MARSRLGPLALEAKLGSRSNAGNVWRAVHIQQRKTLAVKVFPIPFGGTTESRKEFAREWETLKRLRHGSIARCYGGGFEDADAYLAYELIDGESLLDRVQRRERLPWESVLDEAEALAEALAYAHDRQVVHGDLTPDKIRTAGLSPVIVDFRADRFGSPFQSNQSATPFELSFRAPEVLENPRNISPKSDLYSLGAILYYALAGQPPIVGATPEAVKQAAQTQVPAKVATLVLECPVFLSSLVEQLLEKDPAARPFGAGAVVLALREVRRRASEGGSVMQHATSGFSPLKVDADRDEAKALLGYVEEEDEEKPHDGSSFYERPWFLIVSLLLIAAFVAWYLQPLDESEMRVRAEDLLADGSRSALGRAKDEYLLPLVEKFPDGENAEWAQDQIDQIEMLEAERVLEAKLRRGAKLSNEGERLYAQALQFEQFGDFATALDKYTSLVTLLEQEDDQLPFVNLARRQIARIKESGGGASEGQRIVREKLAEAEELLAAGDAVAARKIWYSIIELYEGNLEMASFVQAAQQRLSGSESKEDSL